MRRTCGMYFGGDEQREVHHTVRFMRAYEREMKTQLALYEGDQDYFDLEDRLQHGWIEADRVVPSEARGLLASGCYLEYFEDTGYVRPTKKAEQIMFLEDHLPVIDDVLSAIADHRAQATGEPTSVHEALGRLQDSDVVELPGGHDYSPLEERNWLVWQPDGYAVTIAGKAAFEKTIELYASRL